MRMSRSRLLAGAAGGLTLLAAGAAPANAAPSTASGSGTPASPGRCAVPLPTSVIGDPGMPAGAASGARVWHDGTGWHVRFTHPGTGPQVFTGAIHSPQPITVRGHRLEGQDTVRTRDRGRTVTFRLVNHGAVDGFDFTDRCAVNTSFVIYRDGYRLAPNDVYLGVHGVHPTSNPFLVQRRR